MKLMSCALIIPGPWVGLNSRPTARLVVSSIPADCLREMRFPCTEDFHLASSIQDLLCSRGMTGSLAKMASDNLFHGSSMASLVPQLIRRGLQAAPHSHRSGRCGVPFQRPVQLVLQHLSLFTLERKEPVVWKMVPTTLEQKNHCIKEVMALPSELACRPNSSLFPFRKSF
ncbi:hypothetical protein EDB80DRAFT_371490 [Ilyonectria destructans]|nr:hypothetical protein EDB80DRAFT_371490 [Ilyonectria destructans]